MINKFVLIGALGKRACTVLTQRAISNTKILRQTIKNHEPNDLEKRMLVWSGKYKSSAEVPSFVRYAIHCYILIITLSEFTFLYGNFQPGADGALPQPDAH